VPEADEPHPAPGAADTIEVSPTVLRDLRRERRRRRLAGIEWFDALYRAYLTGGVAIVAVLLLSGLVGDDQISASGLDDLRRLGPAAIGIVAAVAVAVGLRSGSRGGPLGLERAEVRYVLLAPVDRRRALLAPALRQVRFAVFAGAVAGAAIGQLGARRIPDASRLTWAASMALAGVVIGLAAVAAGFVACGFRLPRWVATVLGGLLLAWAVEALVGPVPSPFAAVGALALWPLEFRWWSLLAIPVVLALLIAGLARLGHLSLEAAERRTALVGQLRFAVTVRDLRTVMVLRRQLVQEQHRAQPWFKLRGGLHHPIGRRDAHGILRVPLTRLVRMAALTVIAAVALHVAYHDTAPAALAAALALYLVGLDAVEPLAQEIDQIDRADAIPLERGIVLAHHVPASAVLLAIFAVLGGATAFALNRTTTALAVIAISALPAVWAAGAGGAISVAGEESEPTSDTNQLLPPEVAGMRLMVRSVLPVVVCCIGTLPVVGARVAATNGAAPASGAAQGAVAAALVIAGTVAWLRYREPMKAWWRTMLKESQEESKRRAAGRAA
jgi:hypothetical protein